MGADDDADCVEHVWGLAEVHFSGRGAAMVSRCVRCGAASYQPPDGDNPNRPSL